MQGIIMKGNMEKAPLFLDRGDPFFPTPYSITRAGMSALKNGKTHYTDPCGTIELRQTLAETIYHESGLCYDPEEEILVTSGASVALYTALSVFTRPGDSIMIPDLYWPPYLQMTGLVNGKVLFYKWPLDNSAKTENESINHLLERLSSGVRFLIVNSPHNPSGRIPGKTWIKKLADTIHRFPELIIIADETYYALILGKKNHVSPAQNNALFPRTLLVRSFSKTFAMAGWRIGYIAGPKKLIHPIKVLQSIINTGSSSIAQEAVHFALQKREGIINEFRNKYMKNCYFLVEQLNEEYCFSCDFPEAGIYLFPFIRGLNMDDREFVRILKVKENIHLYPGSKYGDPGKNRVRICFAQPISLLEEFIERLKGFITRCKRG